MAGALYKSPGCILQKFQIPFSGRTVKHTCLAEPAAPDTSSLDLQDHPVLGSLDERHHRLSGIIGMSHIHDHLFLDLFFCMRVIRRKGLNGPVLMILYIIKGRHIDPRHLSRHLQKFFSGLSGFLPFLINI